MTFFAGEQGECQPDNTPILLLCAFAFGALTLYGYKTLRSLPKLAISIDADGLWYAHTSKADGLVPWVAVRGILEKQALQKLVLQDDKGDNLLDIHYQLDGFEELRDTLVQLVSKNFATSAQPTFAKSIGEHVVGVLIIAVYVAFGLYLYFYHSGFFFWICLILAAVLLGVYVRGYYKIYVADNTLFAKSFTRTERYSLQDIEDVIMVDYSDSHGSRRLSTVVVFADESELNLPSLGRSTTEMYIILKNLLSTTVSSR